MLQSEGPRVICACSLFTTVHYLRQLVFQLPFSITCLLMASLNYDTIFRYYLDSTLFFFLFFLHRIIRIHTYLISFVFISLSRIFKKNFKNLKEDYKNNTSSPSRFKEMVKVDVLKWNQLDALGRGKLAYTVNEHDSNIEGRVLEAGKGGHLKPLVYRKRSGHWSIAHERDQSRGYTYALINRLSSPAPSRKPIQSNERYSDYYSECSYILIFVQFDNNVGK